MAELALACLAFLALHVVPSTPLRSWARARLGERAYLGLFSLASVAAISWMVMAYNAAGAYEPLWVTGPLWRWITAVLMLVAVLLLVAGVTTPSPTSVQGERFLERPEPWAGIFAVTRHPLMWAIGLWGLLHLSNRPDAASALLFGSLTLLAIGGAKLQDQRKKAELGEPWQRFEAHTSFIPLAAVLTGRAKLDLRRVGWWRLVLGVLVWAALLHFHGLIFGLSAVPA